MYVCMYIYIYYTKIFILIHYICDGAGSAVGIDVGIGTGISYTLRYVNSPHIPRHT